VTTSRSEDGTPLAKRASKEVSNEEREAIEEEATEVLTAVGRQAKEAEEMETTVARRMLESDGGNGLRQMVVIAVPQAKPLAQASVLTDWKEPRAIMARGIQRGGLLTWIGRTPPRAP